MKIDIFDGENSRFLCLEYSLPQRFHDKDFRSHLPVDLLSLLASFCRLELTLPHKDTSSGCKSAYGETHLAVIWIFYIRQSNKTGNMTCFLLKYSVVSGKKKLK